MKLDNGEQLVYLNIRTEKTSNKVANLLFSFPTFPGHKLQSRHDHEIEKGSFYMCDVYSRHATSRHWLCNFNVSKIIPKFDKSKL